MKPGVDAVDWITRFRYIRCFNRLYLDIMWAHCFRLEFYRFVAQQLASNWGMEAAPLPPLCLRKICNRAHSIIFRCCRPISYVTIFVIKARVNWLNVGTATARCPVTAEHYSYFFVCVSQFQSIALHFRFFFLFAFMGRMHVLRPLHHPSPSGFYFWIFEYKKSSRSKCTTMMLRSPRRT